jgi:hypothetical protein
MATKFADRAFISVNGSPIADLQSASLKRTQNARAVPSMTRNGRNPGFVQGNLDIDVSAVLALRNNSPRPKLEAIDYEANDIQITFVCGAELFIVTGVFLKDYDDNAGGIGDEVKATFNFGALDVTDATGNGALFDLVLG